MKTIILLILVAAFMVFSVSCKSNILDPSKQLDERLDAMGYSIHD